MNRRSMRPPRTTRAGPSNHGRAVRIASIGALAMAYLLIGFPKNLAFTGDEFRYVYQGLGVYTNHAFYPTPRAWAEFVERAGVATAPYRGPIQRPMQALSASVTFGAFLRPFGLAGARDAVWVASVAALSVVFATLRRIARRDGASPWASLAAIAAVALSVPMLAFSKLVYPEVLLLLLVACAYELLRRGRTLASATCVGLLPVVHLRAVPLAIAFAVVLAYDARVRRVPAPRAIGAFALVGIGWLAFAFAQVRSFGRLDGGAFATFAPSVRLAPERLGIALFDVRHGIVPYCPLVLIAFAGLLAGAWRRDVDCAYASVLLSTYVATFMWSDAGESYTARFWVGCLGFLAIGLHAWFVRAMRAGALVAVPLAIVAAVNLALYAIAPQWFLQNRRASLTYDVVYHIAHVYAARVLPIDSALGPPPVTSSIPSLLLWFGAIEVALVGVALARRSRERRVYAAAALVCEAFALLMTATSTLAPARYERRTIATNDIAIRLRADAPSVDAIVLDDELPRYWDPDAYPAYVTYRCGNGTRLDRERVVPAGPLVALDGCARARDISLRMLPTTARHDALSASARITLLHATARLEAGRPFIDVR